MKKWQCVMGVLSLALVFGLLAAGCDNGSSPPTFTVSFDVGEGSGSAPDDMKVEDGKSVSLPGKGNMTAPTGKEFDGWRGDGRNLAVGDSYTVTKNVTFIAQWKTTGGGQGDPNQGNEIEAITLIGFDGGIRVVLDMTKIPTGTTGIQYYISRSGYAKPIQIWFSIGEVPQSLVYPYTNSGLDYTVRTQFTQAVGNGPFNKDVTVKATGGAGEIYLRNTPEVNYLDNNQTINLYPIPEFSPALPNPSGGEHYLGMEMYKADNTGTPVFFTRFPNDESSFHVNNFLYANNNNAQSWAAGQPPLSIYYGQQVFVEFNYYFVYNSVRFKVVFGNSQNFTFPYLNN